MGPLTSSAPSDSLRIHLDEDLDPYLRDALDETGMFTACESVIHQSLRQGREDLVSEGKPSPLIPGDYFTASEAEAALNPYSTHTAVSAAALDPLWSQIQRSTDAAADATQASAWSLQGLEAIRRKLERARQRAERIHIGGVDDDPEGPMHDITCAAGGASPSGSSPTGLTDRSSIVEVVEAVDRATSNYGATSAAGGARRHCRRTRSMMDPAVYAMSALRCSVPGMCGEDSLSSVASSSESSTSTSSGDASRECKKILRRRSRHHDNTTDEEVIEVLARNFAQNALLPAAAECERMSPHTRREALWGQSSFDAAPHSLCTNAMVVEDIAEIQRLLPYSVSFNPSMAAMRDAVLSVTPHAACAVGYPAGGVAQLPGATADATSTAAAAPGPHRVSAHRDAGTLDSDALVDKILRALPTVPAELQLEMSRQRRMIEHLTEVQQEHLRRLAREQAEVTRRRVQAPRVDPTSVFHFEAAMHPDVRRLGIDKVVEPFAVAQQLQYVAADPSQPPPPLVTITTPPVQQKKLQTVKPQARFHEKEPQQRLQDEKAVRRVQRHAIQEARLAPHGQAALARRLAVRQEARQLRHGAQERQHVDDIACPVTPSTAAARKPLTTRMTPATRLTVPDLSWSSADVHPRAEAVAGKNKRRDAQPQPARKAATCARRRSPPHRERTRSPPRPDEEEHTTAVSTPCEEKHQATVDVAADGTDDVMAAEASTSVPPPTPIVTVAEQMAATMEEPQGATNMVSRWDDHVEPVPLPSQAAAVAQPLQPTPGSHAASVTSTRELPTARAIAYTAPGRPGADPAATVSARGPRPLSVQLPSEEELTARYRRPASSARGRGGRRVGQTGRPTTTRLSGAKTQNTSLRGPSRGGRSAGRRGSAPGQTAAMPLGDRYFQYHSTTALPEEYPKDDDSSAAAAPPNHALADWVTATTSVLQQPSRVDCPPSPSATAGRPPVLRTILLHAPVEPQPLWELHAPPVRSTRDSIEEAFRRNPPVVAAAAKNCLRVGDGDDPHDEKLKAEAAADALYPAVRPLSVCDYYALGEPCTGDYTRHWHAFTVEQRHVSSLQKRFAAGQRANVARVQARAPALMVGAAPLRVSTSGAQESAVRAWERAEVEVDEALASAAPPRADASVLAGGSPASHLVTPEVAAEAMALVEARQRLDRMRELLLSSSAAQVVDPAATTVYGFPSGRHARLLPPAGGEGQAESVAQRLLRNIADEAVHTVLGGAVEQTLYAEVFVGLERDLLMAMIQHVLDTEAKAGQCRPDGATRAETPHATTAIGTPDAADTEEADALLQQSLEDAIMWQLMTDARWQEVYHAAGKPGTASVESGRDETGEELLRLLGSALTADAATAEADPADQTSEGVPPSSWTALGPVASMEREVIRVLPTDNEAWQHDGPLPVQQLPTVSATTVPSAAPPPHVLVSVEGVPAAHSQTALTTPTPSSTTVRVVLDMAPLTHSWQYAQRAGGAALPLDVEHSSTRIAEEDHRHEGPDENLRDVIVESVTVIPTCKSSVLPPPPPPRAEAPGTLPTATSGVPPPPPAAPLHVAVSHSPRGPTPSLPSPPTTSLEHATAPAVTPLGSRPVNYPPLPPLPVISLMSAPPPLPHFGSEGDGREPPSAESGRLWADIPPRPVEASCVPGTPAAPGHPPAASLEVATHAARLRELRHAEDDRRSSLREREELQRSSLHMMCSMIADMHEQWRRQLHAQRSLLQPQPQQPAPSDDGEEQASSKGGQAVGRLPAAPQQPPLPSPPAPIRDPVTRLIFEWLRNFGDRADPPPRRTMLEELNAAADTAAAPITPQSPPPTTHTDMQSQVSSSSSPVMSSTHPSSYGPTGRHLFYTSCGAPAPLSQSSRRWASSSATTRYTATQHSTEGSTSDSSSPLYAGSGSSREVPSLTASGVVQAYHEYMQRHPPGHPARQASDVTTRHSTSTGDSGTSRGSSSTTPQGPAVHRPLTIPPPMPPAQSMPTTTVTTTARPPGVLTAKVRALQEEAWSAASQAFDGAFHVHTTTHDVQRID